MRQSRLPVRFARKEKYQSQNEHNHQPPPGGHCSPGKGIETMKRYSQKQKQILFKEYFAIANAWAEKEDKLLVALVDAQKITSGYLLIHISFENHGYKMIAESFCGSQQYHWQNITGWDLQYYVNLMKEGLAEVQKIIEKHT